MTPARAPGQTAAQTGSRLDPRDISRGRRYVSVPFAGPHTKSNPMATEPLTPLTDLERDALGELANIAMARAATSLRQMIQHEVLLSVPEIEILSPEAAVQAVSRPGNPNLVAVRQDFKGIFSGRALLIFPEANSLELVRVIVGRQLPLEDIVDLEDEALAETGNIILNSWVSVLANLLNQPLKMSLPVVIRRDQHSIFKSSDAKDSRILFLHIKFDVRTEAIQGYLALMMDIPSTEGLRALVDEYISGFNPPED
jgi:chemotaxis protein CheC